MDSAMQRRRPEPQSILPTPSQQRQLEIKLSECRHRNPTILSQCCVIGD